jgi:hypothetical protein
MELRVIYWSSQKRSCSHVAQLHGALQSKKRLPCRIKGTRNNKKFPWEVPSRVVQQTENRNQCSLTGKSVTTFRADTGGSTPLHTLYPLRESADQIQ